MISNMNYFPVTLLGLLTCAQYLDIVSISCIALKLDEGDPCQDPAEACNDLGKESLVYNPEDCHQFYACIVNSSGNVVPSDNPIQCPEDLTFDYKNQNCSSEISSCDKACINTGCAFECTSTTEGLVADPKNCSIYYFCYHGTMSSPSFCDESNPYFDGIDCTNKEYLCCDSSTVYCTSKDSGKNIADPNDCTAFYTCEKDEGIPKEILHFHCADGEYFESDFGRCMSGTEPCNQI